MSTVSNSNQSALFYFLSNAYQGIDGYESDFGEGVDDFNPANNAVDTTYGELTLEGAQCLLDRLGVTPGSTFYDIGCGTGKVVIHAALSTGAHAVGIEIVRARYEKAVRVLRFMRYHIDAIAAEFIYGDATKLDLTRADFLWMNATTWPPELICAIVRRTGEKAIIAINVEVPRHMRNYVRLIDQLVVPVTWCPFVHVYVYQRLRDPVHKTYHNNHNDQRERSLPENEQWRLFNHDPEYCECEEQERRHAQR